ncbi:Fanconi anemia group B protein [Chelonia mydas]|uniref:Fanconi anemia group B protein n=1 Tax=Chelonia mydas TaxID=8469 RepID=M7AKM6_CHEMY|nr:Fanconi anemia group B protein [Chelonia mydas]
MLYVVSFASGNVCAVQKDSFQVASRWQEVKSVLVDDFIGTGTEQILLLFKDESNTDSLSTFIITDFGEVSYASNINCKEDFPPTEELQENGFLTIQALEARLQEGLVSLWDDEEDFLYPLDKKMTLTSEVPEHLIEKLWQRVVDDSLVIGVKITESPNLNQTVLFQCLHSLIGVLPPTCKVKLLRLESKDILTDQFARALEKEMVTLRSSFSSAVSEVENSLTLSCEAGKEMSRVTVSSLSDKKEAVRQFREKLQNEQKQSALGMNRTVGGALYRQITSKIAEAQLCSDMIAWRLNVS